MLADEYEYCRYAGALDPEIQLPGEWFNALVKFIGGVLPGWRDDATRPHKINETALTAQLCSRLTSASRHTPGWDFLQFKREEPDEIDGRRSIDLVASPSGSLIWIDGRQYSEYQTLMPIECKRLPTPSGPDRDEREYLYSSHTTTGGVQRFKAGHHAALHSRAAMIGYIQESNILAWMKQLDGWIEGLETDAVDGWSAADKLEVVEHDCVSRFASLISTHIRKGAAGSIRLDHLWIEM